MPPYELSDFHMPYPVRVNLHLDTVWVHTTAWVRDMGTLDAPQGDHDSVIWDEVMFDSMEFAALCLNDLYSMATKSDTDFDLPEVVAAEEKCSPGEAIERSLRIHNELMRTFVEEVTALSHLGSLAPRRFLADLWAWFGGNREWHSTTERYHGASNA